MNWISVNERLPESGQEILTYYKDTTCGDGYEFDQIDLLHYFKVGHTDNDPIPGLIIVSDGFYVFSNKWYRHKDIITHWMPLPAPPNTYICPQCKNSEHSQEAKYCIICGLKIEKEADGNE